MVEGSRDGQGVYVTNSLDGPWDDQFYGGDASSDSYCHTH
jgi:hypothetical protein